MNVFTERFHSAQRDLIFLKEAMRFDKSVRKNLKRALGSVEAAQKLYENPTRRGSLPPTDERNPQAARYSFIR